MLVKHLGRCLPPPRSYLPHTPSFGHPVSGPQCRVRLGWGRKVLGSCTKEGGLWVRSEGTGIRDMRFKEGTAPRMLSVSVKLVLIDGGVPSPLNPPSASSPHSELCVPPPDTRAHLFLVHFSPGFVSTLGFPGWEGCREGMEPARGGWVPVVSPATTQTEGQVDMHTRGTRSTFLNLSLLICKLRLRHHHGYLVVFLFFSRKG